MARPLPDPAAILLDLDNTVYAYAPCHQAGLAAAQVAAGAAHAPWREAAAFHADFDEARRQVKAHTRGTAAEHSRLACFKRMLERAGLGSRLLDALELERAYWAGYFDAMRPDPDCLELIGDWRAAGVGLAWVTDFPLERQILKLRALGVEDAAGFLVTSEEAGVEKPHPRMVELALERLGLPAERAWLVGDSLERDVGAASAAGVAAVWLRRGDAATQAGLPAPWAIAGSWPELRTLWEQARG